MRLGGLCCRRKRLPPFRWPDSLVITRGLLLSRFSVAVLFLPRDYTALGLYQDIIRPLVTNADQNVFNRAP